MSFTFKSQEKHNAKRFLVKTCKIDASCVDLYLTQDGGGHWGVFLDADGKPVPHATVAAAMEQKIAALAAETGGKPFGAETTVATLPTEGEVQALADTATDSNTGDADEQTPAPSPEAAKFGAFALSQLGASTTPAPAPAAAREGVAATAGLKIQKDRPTQNGIKRQSAGSVGDKLWALYDAAGHGVTLQQAKKLAEDAGLSTTSAAIALYNWRKFHGITKADAK